MTTPAALVREQRPVSGIVHILIGAFVLTLQDGVIKWLVVDYSLFQTLFLRSITMIALALMIWMPRKGAGHFHTSRPLLNLLRVVFHFATFILFFTGISLMPLGDVIALALTASLFMALLSGPIAGEPASRIELLAVVVGFAGVILIAGPSGSDLPLGAVAIVLLAAVCYAGMSLVTRLLGNTEPAERMIVYSACGITLASGLVLPWVWKPADAATIALMMGLGIVSIAGHWFLVQAYRLAPVHIVAPFEYTALVWGIIIGFVFWNEEPTAGMLSGAGLIVIGGLIIVYNQHRRINTKTNQS